MSNLDRFLEKGAQVVAGDVILRHKVMGRLRSGDFFVTEDGLAELEIEDVVTQDVAPRGRLTRIRKTIPTLGADVELDVTE